MSRITYKKSIVVSKDVVLDHYRPFNHLHNSANLIRTMSRYATAHANLQGPGDARPTALDIIRDDKVVGIMAVNSCVLDGDIAAQNQ